MLRASHCHWCNMQLPHPPKVKVLLPGLTAWLARRTPSATTREEN